MQRRSRRPAPRAWALGALAVYLVVLAMLTLRPAGSEETQQDLRLNLRPLATIVPALELGPRSFSFRVLVGNLIAFVPLGILVPLVRKGSSSAFVLGAGVCLSAGIELTQLAVSAYVGYGYRSADVDDVIVNVLGTAIGFAAFALGSVFGRTFGEP